MPESTTVYMPESTTNSQPASEPVEPAISPEELSVLEQIDKLLAGTPNEPEAGDGHGPAQEPEKDEPEQPAKEPEKAIDYDMKVPMTGGDPVTLSALKDAYQQQHVKMQETIEREQAVTKQTQHLEYLAQFFDDLPAPLMAERRQQAAQYAATQERLLHEAVPATRTPDGAKEFLDKVASVAEQYGVERGRVQAGMDSAVLRMAYDFARLQEAVKAARANVKPLRSEQPRASQGIQHTSDLDQAISTAKRSGNQADQVAAIDKLLRRA